MTSISAANFQASFPSPLDRLQSELNSEVSAGTIASSDQSALSAALKDIDSQLRSGSSQSSGTSPPSRSDMKAKIDSLISSEVKSGKLTSDQAAELQKVFANTLQNGHGGPGGPPPGAPGGTGGADSSSGGDGAQGSSTDSDITNLLADFMKLLQSGTNQQSTYGANGQSQTRSAALLVDFQS